MAKTTAADEAIARVQLRALVEEYSWALDRQDRDGYAATFTPDGELTMLNPQDVIEPSYRIKGAAQLRDAVDTEKKFEKVFHTISNQHITILDEKSATGICHFTVHHLYDEGGQAKSLVMLVHAYDVYELTDDGWKFASRRLDQQWAEVVDASLNPFYKAQE